MDYLCPWSVWRWDGNLNIIEEFLELLELRVICGQVEGASICGDNATLRRSPDK